MTENECLAKMVPPSQPRPSAWRQGVIQIHVTRSCDKSCFGCTQGSNLQGKKHFISPEEFEAACQSLEGYWGVVGMFGGNPATHPEFETLCEILSNYFPFEQRGLWCNNPLKKGAIMRKTFNPEVSNLNVHLSEKAYAEFKRDWPESRPFGLTEDSRHSPPFVAMKDVIEDLDTRLELISNCDINKYWSAMVCVIPGRGLRAYFCELAGAQAILHAHDPTWPDVGIDPTKKYQLSYYEPKLLWWQLPMGCFSEQVKLHCHSCGIPLRRYGQLAVNGEYEEVSETHAAVYSPKSRGRTVNLVQIDEGLKLSRVTDYIPNSHS